MVVESHPAGSSRPFIIALFGDIRAWKGRPGYSQPARDRVAQLVAAGRAAKRDVVIVQFSHPRLADQLPADVPILCAWGGEVPMQEAAATRLMQQA